MCRVNRYSTLNLNLYVNFLQFDEPHSMLFVNLTLWFLSWSCLYFVALHFSFETISTTHSLFQRCSYTFPKVVAKQNALFPTDCWAWIRFCSLPPSAYITGLKQHQPPLEPALQRYLLPLLLAEMNVAQREQHPPGCLGPTLLCPMGTTGPESWYRHPWLFTGPGSLWEPSLDGFWRGWWSLFQWE